MATYSTRLRLVKQDTNENINTWGAVLNASMIDMIDEAVAGVETIAVTGGTTTLTTANGSSDNPRNAVLVFTGSLGSVQTVNVPATEKNWIIYNNTTGTHRFLVKTSSGTGVEIPQGTARQVYCDGTNVLLGSLPANQFFEPLNGTPTRTGNTTFTIPGDMTALAPINTMLKIDHGSGTVYQNVTAISHAAGTTTVTVTVVGGNLPSDLRRVWASALGNREVLTAVQVRGALSTLSGGTVTGALGATTTLTAGTSLSVGTSAVVGTSLSVGTTSSLVGAVTLGSAALFAASVNAVPAATLPTLTTSNIVNFTGGTATVTAVHATTPRVFFARLNAGNTLTHSSTFFLPGLANYVTQDGDSLVAYLAGTAWMMHLIRSDGLAMKERFAVKYAKLSNVQASGTGGGTATSGAYEKVTLNTEVDPNGIVTGLTASVFTLAAGTYYIKARSPGYNVDLHKCKIRNTSDGSDTLIGTAEYTDGAATSTSIVEGQFTITASKNFELQHRVSNTVATVGRGNPCTFGDSEVYAVVEIWKID